VIILRFIARGFVVALFLLGHSLIWFFGWLGLLLSLRGKAARQRWFGVRLAALMRDLGATFVKVGQIMSTRPDLLPPHVTGALEKLQDDVGAFPYRHVERTILEDFGKSPDQLFTRFDRTPIASASVAQVHRAELPDGTAVAVKVRRPKLDQIVQFDLTVMTLFARFVALVPSFRLLAPVESVAEFGRAIRMQIDLSIEADNNRRFRSNFADDSDVAFPELFDELCSPRVITMTFIDGVKVLEVDREVHDAKRLARVGFHTLLAMIFDHGFVHADLHPGNILVTEDGTVVLLDLGLTAELDETYRRGFGQYFAGWAQGNGKVMARLMHDLSPAAHVEDYDAYEAEVTEFVAKYYGKQLGEVQVSTVAFDMMNILRRHRVRANPVYTMCNIAIAVTEGIGKQLAPDLDLMQETIPFFMKLQSAARL
jgi:ubiquinone biosynthesis protein